MYIDQIQRERQREAQMFLHIFSTIGHSDRMNDEQLSRVLSKMEIQKKERKKIPHMISSDCSTMCLQYGYQSIYS